MQVLHDGLPLRRSLVERGGEGRRADPACVAACCASARFYGDLDDPDSDVSKAISAADSDSVHSLKDVGNKPATRYILSKKIATWHDVDELSPASDSADPAWFAKEA